jgi:hypothetical protein
MLRYNRNCKMRFHVLDKDSFICNDRFNFVCRTGLGQCKKTKELVDDLDKV